MIGLNNHEAQSENRTDTEGENITLNNTNDPTQGSGFQVDVHTLDKNIVDKKRNDVDSVMATVETRVQDAILTEIEFGDSEGGFSNEIS